MEKNKTGFSLYYDFEYKNHKEKYYDYEVPLELFIEGAKEYFDFASVIVKGTDTKIWNLLSDLKALDNMFELIEDDLKELCKEDAYEEFKDYVDYYYDDDLDEGDDLSWK